ncbi:hypothetical protein ACFLYU_02725 [Candidatus Dependentiae bacterium]
MNKKLLSFVLLGSILGSFTQTQCVSVKDVLRTMKKSAIVASSALFGLAIYRFFSKKSVKEPKSRFEEEQLSKDTWNQIWYFIDDIFIGQSYKKASVKVVKEGEKTNLDINLGAPPSGMLGHIHANVYPIGKAICFFAVLNKMLEKWKKGFCAWKYYTGYDSNTEYEL